MTIFDEVKLFCLICGTTLICIVLFNAVMLKMIQSHIDESFNKGYQRAVEDISKSGYFQDEDGNVHYVIVSEAEYMEV